MVAQNIRNGFVQYDIWCEGINCDKRRGKKDNIEVDTI
jgi:hypothetical protein